MLIELSKTNIISEGRKNIFLMIAEETTSNVGRTFVKATLFLSNVVREFPSLESNSTML